jgi:hypothetical protein
MADRSWPAHPRGIPESEGRENPDDGSHIPSFVNVMAGSCG